MIEAGKLLVNPKWLEYLLNLFYQGYVGEYADEIQDTICNCIKTIENVGYGTIFLEFDKKHLGSLRKTQEVSHENSNLV